MWIIHRLYECIHGVIKSHDGEETSSGSFSRSSSFTSLNRKHFDEQMPFMVGKQIAICYDHIHPRN